VQLKPLCFLYIVQPLLFAVYQFPQRAPRVVVDVPLEHVAPALEVATDCIGVSPSMRHDVEVPVKGTQGSDFDDGVGDLTISRAIADQGRIGHQTPRQGALGLRDRVIPIEAVVPRMNVLLTHDLHSRVPPRRSPPRSRTR
jgi:hypothetical protein